MAKKKGKKKADGSERSLFYSEPREPYFIARFPMQYAEALQELAGKRKWYRNTLLVHLIEEYLRTQGKEWLKARGIVLPDTEK